MTIPIEKALEVLVVKDTAEYLSEQQIQQHSFDNDPMRLLDDIAFETIHASEGPYRKSKVQPKPAGTHPMAGNDWRGQGNCKMRKK